MQEEDACQGEPKQYQKSWTEEKNVQSTLQRQYGLTEHGLLLSLDEIDFQGKFDYKNNELIAEDLQFAFLNKINKNYII